MSNKDKVSTETGRSDVTPPSVSMVTADESCRHAPDLALHMVMSWAVTWLMSVFIHSEPAGLFSFTSVDQYCDLNIVFQMKRAGSKTR